MRKHGRFFCALLIVLWACGLAQAETAYVTEKCGEQERALAEKLSAQSRALAQANEGLQAMTEKYKALLAKSEQAAAAKRDDQQKDNAPDAAELQTLRAENEALKRTSGIKWFLAGGGVMLCGWLLGRISRKKKGSSRLLD